MDTCRTAAVAVARPRWHRARPDLNGLRAARTRKGELRTRAQVIGQAAAPARLVDRLLAGAGATGSLCACANRGDRLARCSPDHREHPAAVTPFPPPSDDTPPAVRPAGAGRRPRP